MLSARQCWYSNSIGQPQDSFNPLPSMAVSALHCLLRLQLGLWQLYKVLLSTPLIVSLHTSDLIETDEYNCSLTSEIFGSAYNLNMHTR